MSISSSFLSTKAGSQIMSSILVIGGGLTSGVASALLTEGSTKSVSLSVWDKARGCGGRMSTSRSPSNASCTADLGAQYITATPQYQADHKKFYDELKNKGLLSPLTSDIEGSKASDSGTIDYVMPNGSSSIVKHFFEKSGLKIQFDHLVETIVLENNKWTVSTKSGKKESFDCVVLTMPTPQIVQVAQQILKSKPDLKSQLEAVEYSSRYGLAFFYDSDMSDSVKFEGKASAKYISDPNSIYRFVALDNVKRNVGGSTSVIFHTSVPYGVKNVEQTVEQLQPQLIAEAQKLFPNWPKPDHIKCQKWRYSQVSKPFLNSPGFVVLHEDPLLIAGGDGFVHSNFDGCVTSAEKIVQVIQSKIQL